MSIAAVREYVAHLWAEYQAASRRRRSAILDELQRNLGVHRKSATRLMRKGSAPPGLRRGKGSGGRPCYSERTKSELKTLWREIGYLGAARLKAALPEWLPHYQGILCDEATREELLRMSARTIERTLKTDKADLRRRLNGGTQRGKTRYETRVPIRNFTEAAPASPGHCEVDCVAHCGGSLSGTFAWTVTLTDIATGATECEAIWGKNGFAVRQALTEIEKRLPFPLLSLYFDNGCEFMNDEVIDRFAEAARERKIDVFRGRPYRKNDQPYVEQKNYTHVRALFGYERLDFKLAVQLMNNVYRKEWRLLQTHFYPQMKLLEKVRLGSRIRRVMSVPETPYRRLLAIPALTEEAKEALAAEHRCLNPFALRTTLRRKLRAFRLYLDKASQVLGRYAL